ncbi:hypothetical protein IV203_020994 [Nitzschia inconspicua]|uniref:Uncharacterized protein n=1 Tax=Nitzschia inconspicua TaxID=303405 RepID=A0A9K3PFK4_9STRA|nr:hypothetical protein IV203_020994 [Nitzschia inconspicua]
MAPLYGVWSRTDAFSSVWMVVDAIHRTTDLRLVFPENHDDQRQLAMEFSNRSKAGFHRTTDLRLVFPENHDDQRQLAMEFSNRSKAGFNRCVGAVDGILRRTVFFGTSSNFILEVLQFIFKKSSFPCFVRFIKFENLGPDLPRFID